MRQITIRPVFLALACGACTAGPSPVEPLAAGDWGGDHVLVSVSSAGVAFEFDCAHGVTDAPITIGGQGHFRATGLLATEGGPARQPPEAGVAVVYEGDRHGRRLDFTLALSDASQPIGEFSAVLGAAPRLFKCLSTAAGQNEVAG
jgi:hypothetical protein